MLKTIYITALILLIFSCSSEEKKDNFSNTNWDNKQIDIPTHDSLEEGKTYLSIYSQIYSISEHKTHNLTAMISIRNTSETDTIYLEKVKYYDTKGNLVKNYITNSIFITPLETIEIIINEHDIEGGTGSNFIFDWKKQPKTSEPLFEGIMNSTIGQQGLSFTTQGKRIN